MFCSKEPKNNPSPKKYPLDIKQQQNYSAMAEDRQKENAIVDKA